MNGPGADSWGGEDRPFDWPFFGLKDDVRPALEQARATGDPAVLATLFDVEGSTPRRLGAQMVFSQAAVSGFVSGGCIEADLAEHARQILARRQPETLIYGEGGPLDIRLPCGSSIRLLLEPILPDDEAVAQLLRLSAERRRAIWVTNGDERACCAVEDIGALPPAFHAASRAFLESGETCGYAAAPFMLLRAYRPTTRVVAIGSDPITLAVVKLAAEMGLDTALVRPNGPETCPLTQVRYSRSDARSALAEYPPDAWTAVAVLSHDRDEEQAALASALATDAGYVGVLGSRRRIPERNERLKASGFGQADIERIHAPIGLPIASETTWEIAVSIIAEILGEIGNARSDRA